MKNDVAAYRLVRNFSMRFRQFFFSSLDFRLMFFMASESPLDSPTSLYYHLSTTARGRCAELHKVPELLDTDRTGIIIIEPALTQIYPSHSVPSS